MAQWVPEAVDCIDFIFLVHLLSGIPACLPLGARWFWASLCCYFTAVLLNAPAFLFHTQHGPGDKGSGRGISFWQLASASTFVHLLTHRCVVICCTVRKKDRSKAQSSCCFQCYRVLTIWFFLYLRGKAQVFPMGSRGQ